MAGAALLHSLVHNHPFHNGNKRTALVALFVFLDENHFLLTCDEDAVFTMVLQVARHRIVDPHQNDLPDREVLAIAEWLAANARPIRQGDRPLPFHKVRRILTDHGCKVTGHGGSGSSVNIERFIPPQRGFIFRHAARTLHTQVYYGGEGREVARNTINKIRADLELDDDHGVDSAAFYEASPCSASDFIITYRKTLRRLSGL
jgi:death-on-curing protein